MAGASSLAAWLLLAFASHEARGATLPMFFGVLAAAWMALGAAWWSAAYVRELSVRRAVWIWALLIRAAAIWAQPVFEDDWARYLWDGRQFALTGNPYASAPAEHFADERVPPAFERLLDEINHPHLPTVYAPLPQLAFALSYAVAPAQLWPWKLLLTAADFLSVALLLKLVTPRQALLFAWCPLLIHESGFNAHPDSLWVCCLVAALVALRHGRARRVAIFLGLAATAKIFALIIAPFLLARLHWRGAVLALTVACAGYAPFWLQGSAAEFAGLRAMAGEWEFNSTAVALLTAWSDLPSAKRVAAGLFTLVWLVLFVRWLPRERSDLPRGDVVFGAFFLLSAVVNPWYLLAMLPFVAVRPTAWGVSALAVVPLSYAHGLYRSEPGLAAYELPSWVPWTEAGVVLLLAVGGHGLLRSRGASTEGQRN